MIRIISSIVAGIFLGLAQFAQGNEEPPEPLSPDEVVLSRGDATITVRDFEAALLQLPSEVRKQAANDLGTIEKLMSQLLENQLIAEAARKEGLADQPVIEAALRQAENKVLARQQMEKIIEDAPEADLEQMAHEYYVTHKGEFKVGPKISVRHVLIATEDRSEEEARERAMVVYEKATGGEASLVDLVEEYSDDPGAERNLGLYSDMSPDRFVKPFADAAMALEPGEISEPVKSQFGYHVIELEAFEPSGHKDFENVKSDLVKRMRKQHVERIKKQYLSELLDGTSLEVNDEALKALRRHYRAEFRQ